MSIKIIECIISILICCSFCYEITFICRIPLAIFVYKLFKSDFKAFKELVVFINLTIVIYIIEYCTAYWAFFFFDVAGIIIACNLCHNYIVVIYIISIINTCHVILVCNLMSYNCLTVNYFRCICVILKDVIVNE